jgi:hypothetical protein
MISRNEAIHSDDPVNQPVEEVSNGLPRNRAKRRLVLSDTTRLRPDGLKGNWRVRSLFLCTRQNHDSLRALGVERYSFEIVVSSSSMVVGTALTTRLCVHPFPSVPGESRRLAALSLLPGAGPVSWAAWGLSFCAVPQAFLDAVAASGDGLRVGVAGRLTVRAIHAEESERIRQQHLPHQPQRQLNLPRSGRRRGDNARRRQQRSLGVIKRVIGQRWLEIGAVEQVEHLGPELQTRRL